MQVDAMFPKLVESRKEPARSSIIMKTPECLQLIESNESLSLQGIPLTKLCSPQESRVTQARVSLLN